MIDAAQPSPLISARGITKSFGAVRALRGVGLDILPGQVHGLVGANGAGKSTFLNMLAGVVSPDGGELLVDGRPAEIGSPRQAADLGFAFIHQELALVPEFSAIDNMTIGVRPSTFLGLGDARRHKAIAREVAARLDLRFPLEKPVRDLSIAERGLVAIGRALVGDARFVSMDEPTASLSDVECERLFAIVRELTASGVAVAYVSHRLDEIEELCDAVTVFKDGQVVAAHERGAYTRDDLVLGSRAPAPSRRRWRPRMRRSPGMRRSCCRCAASLAHRACTTSRSMCAEARSSASRASWGRAAPRPSACCSAPTGRSPEN